MRRRELAAFLRTRREQLTPDDLGIVSSGRRRTPGLRRDEVAGLSGVSLTWYTALEQARDIHVSAQVLQALARSLRLDDDERRHLYALAGAVDNSAVLECDAVSPEMHALLSKLDPYPACIHNGRFDLLAYNRAMRHLITDLDEVPLAERNCIWLSFTDARWRQRIVDWEKSVERQVANLRVAMADHLDDGLWKSLVGRLGTTSPDFADLWGRHVVRDVEYAALRRIAHPGLGLLEFTVSNTWVARSSATRLQVFLPADARTGSLVTTLSDQQELTAAVAV
jgi:transcriptional regulator with XRE-family HTH domain